MDAAVNLFEMKVLETETVMSKLYVHCGGVILIPTLEFFPLPLHHYNY